MLHVFLEFLDRACTSINLYKKLWPNLDLLASSSNLVCLLINMHKEMFLVFMHSNVSFYSSISEFLCI
jgi:hypothetical protein